MIRSLGSKHEVMQLGIAQWGKRNEEETSVESEKQIIKRLRGEES